MPDPELVIEDGTVVTDANSYVTTDQVAAYANAHDGGQAWNAANPNTQIRACVFAWEYLRNESRYMYRGIRHSYLQNGSWPRDEAAYYRGQDIPSGFIPQPVMDAQCDLAIRCVESIGVGVPLPTTLQPDLEHGGIVQTEKIGPLTTTFFEGAPPETVLQSIQGILAPLLRIVIDDITPAFLPQHATSPYLPGQFDYGRPGYGGPGGWDPTGETL